MVLNVLILVLVLDAYAQSTTQENIAILVSGFRIQYFHIKSISTYLNYI